MFALITFVNGRDGIASDNMYAWIIITQKACDDTKYTKVLGSSFPYLVMPNMYR